MQHPDKGRVVPAGDLQGLAHGGGVHQEVSVDAQVRGVRQLDHAQTEVAVPAEGRALQENGVDHVRRDHLGSTQRQIHRPREPLEQLPGIDTAPGEGLQEPGAGLFLAGQFALPGRRYALRGLPVHRLNALQIGGIGKADAMADFLDRHERVLQVLDCHRTPDLVQQLLKTDLLHAQAAVQGP